MYRIRSHDQRGTTKTNWLDSKHSFSFAQFYDLSNMGFSDLRVINDDIVQPGQGFGTHHHENMEIISIVIEGALEHKDSTGAGSIIKPGDIQKMTAGTGVFHSEYNPSHDETVRFLQIWIFPDKKNLKPCYEQKNFPLEKMLNKLCLIVSPEGKAGSLKINQDAEIFQSILEADKVIKFKLDSQRRYWIQIIDGVIKTPAGIFEEGDGLAITNEDGHFELKGIDNRTNLLLFNLRG